MISSNQTADQDNKEENQVAHAVNVNKSNDAIPQSLSPTVIAQIMDKGQSQPQSQSLKQIQNEYPQYDWDNKWLKGDEYANMLEKIEEYCKQYNLQKFGKKTHPEDIYRAPQNGLIYFVEGNCVGSEFGFPRVPFRKQYRWKKMNFTTDLPKKRPQVTYIVASSVKCQKSQGNDKQKSDNNKKEQDVYRMHAVILYKNSQAKQQQQQQTDNVTGQNSSTNNSDNKQYILCHIRKIDNNYEDKIPLHRQGTINSNSGSESSQDLAVNSSSQKSGKSNKAGNKKLMINESKSSEGEYEDNESYEVDEIEQEEVNENKAIKNQRKISINENISNQESNGQYIQTLQPHDSNKLTKPKSKHLSKQLNKLRENCKKNENTQSNNGQVGLETNPELPTEILNTYLNAQQLISKFAQGHQDQKKNKTNEHEDKTLKEINNNNNQSNIKQNIGKIDGAQQINSQKQQQPSKNLMQASPGNYENNSTSSSNSNHNNDEQQQQILKQISLQQQLNSAFQNPQQQFTNNSHSLLQNLLQNQVFHYGQNYPLTQGGGGMMMIQPPTNFLQLQYMYLNPQQYLTANQNPLNIQQQQQQNYLSQQQSQQLIQNITRIPSVNLDLLQIFLQSQNPNELNYRDMYSLQMNSGISNNLVYNPNQNNSNAP